MKIITFTRIINMRIFYLILYGGCLSLALIPYYTDDTFIFGGEGDYFLDFSMYSQNYGFAWFSTYGTGMPMYAPGAVGFNIFILIFLEKLTGSIAFTNFVLIFAIYFGPFIGMYLVCKELKATPFVSFAVSLFYVINPFMLYYLIALNQWNVFSVTIMPLLLWCILKYYHSNFKLFFVFGIVSTCFSFAYANPPMLVIVQISILLSVMMVSYYCNERFILAEMIKKYSVVFLSFLIFNLWWILVLFRLLSSAREFYQGAIAKSTLLAVSGSHRIIGKTWELTTHIPDLTSNDFFSFWYRTLLANFITLIPILILAVYLLIVKKKKGGGILNIAIISVLLIVLFFVKGNASPFGFIYNFLFENIPFFNIFKTPTEKFGLLYVFILSILLLLIIKELNNKKYYKYFISLFMVYLIFCSIPVITGNIIPEYKVDSFGFVSRKYKDKVEYKQVRKILNKDNIEYRVLSLPGVANYQILMKNYNNKYYTGLDPVLNNVNKPSIASHHNIHSLYRDFSSANYVKLLGIYNIRKIMINEDSLPWFGKIEKESVADLKNIFGAMMPSRTWEGITLYDNQDDFIPRIYASAGKGQDNEKKED